MSVTPRQGRRRRRFNQTADEFVASLVKGKGLTTAEVNAAWRKAGRSGNAGVTLGRLVKAGTVKRTKLKGQRGSSYRIR